MITGTTPVDYLVDDPRYQEAIDELQKLIDEQRNATASFLNHLAADETNYEGERR